MSWYIIKEDFKVRPSGFPPGAKITATFQITLDDKVELPQETADQLKEELSQLHFSFLALTDEQTLHPILPVKTDPPDVFRQGDNVQAAFRWEFRTNELPEDFRQIKIIFDDESAGWIVHNHLLLQAVNDASADLVAETVLRFQLLENLKRTPGNQVRPGLIASSPVTRLCKKTNKLLNEWRVMVQDLKEENKKLEELTGQSPGGKTTGPECPPTLQPVRPDKEEEAGEEMETVREYCENKKFFPRIETVEQTASGLSGEMKGYRKILKSAIDDDDWEKLYEARERLRTIRDLPEAKSSPAAKEEIDYMFNSIAGKLRYVKREEITE